MFLKLLYMHNPKLAQEFEFKFSKMSDLFKLDTALKVEALNFWGTMQKTGNQQVWYVTIVHWGEHRIWPYYCLRKNEGILPDDFTFNKDTIREDVRDPLQYWGLWYGNWARFKDFQIKVGIEQWYDKRYRQECSAIEWQFIYSWKYVKQIIKDAEELRSSKLKFEKDYLKKNKKLEKKIRNLDSEYRRLNGLIKSGKFKSIFKEVFYPAREAFKNLAKEIGSPKTKTFRKIIIIATSMVGVIIIIFTIIGIITLVKKITLRRKRDKFEKQKI